MNENEYFHNTRDVLQVSNIPSSKKTCIFDKDIFETGPIYPLYCEGVHSHSKQKPSAFSPYSLYFPSNPDFFSINKQWQLYVEKALE